MPLIKAEVDSNQKTAFRHAAKSQGMTETELLRQMVNQVIGAKQEGAAPEKINRSHRTTVSFTKKEFDHMTKRSRGDGFSRHTAWIVGLVRAVLYRDPTFAADEIDVLRESNREIAAIGRNLNQIARAINVDFREGERLKRAEIKALSDDLAAHRQKVAALIDQSLNRWRVEDE
jgi:antitoxin component of RelBE/YafQ-DinJ toxin-antitoxin module